MAVHNQHFLVLTVLGKDHLNLLGDLTKIGKQTGCNILESKISTLGSECAMLFHFNGSWSAIAKLEAALPAFAQQNDLAIQIKRTIPTPHPTAQTTALPYQITVFAQDRAGILHELAEFFSHREIRVETIDCETNMTKNMTPRISINGVVEIPTKNHLATIREQFLTYCEDRNLDATLEPFR